ncbi:MAG: ribonuclease III [Ilumatobacter sp.]|nr:ribonuclease III [Ilumatobacter sp.]
MADPVPPDDELGALVTRIGYDFTDPDLLRRALAHRSWCAETPGSVSNERLEFLGDAVLGWVIADIAFHRFEDLPEGLLTDLRKSVVNAITLAEIAEEIGLGPYLLLGKGEAAADGAEKPSILSDAFEAVLGAVYLDGGVPAAHAMVDRWVAPRMSKSIDRIDQLDHKTQLQELCARVGREAPAYVVTSTGPDHAKSFVARVTVDGEPMGEGTGRSKKAAEQAAAAVAAAALTSA